MYRCFILFIIIGISAAEDHKRKTYKDYTVIDILKDNILQESWSPDEKPCLDQMLYTLKSAKNSTLWATWILDSIQAPLGVLYASKSNLGNFDQCMKPPWVSTNPELKTQYCLADVTLSEKKPGDLIKDPYETANAYINSYSRFKMKFNGFMWGVCVPAKCRKNSVGKIFSALYGTSHLVNVQPEPKIIVDSCQISGAELPKHMGYYVFKYITIFAVMSAFIGTLIASKQTGDSSGIARAFSIRTNAANLVTQTEEDILVIHGVRTIISCIVVGLHVHFVNTWVGVGNALYLEKEVEDTGIIYMYQLESIVDAYLVLSGLFLMRNFMKSAKFSPLMVILKRYLRFIFFVGPTVLYFLFVHQHTGSGPIWVRLIDIEIDSCSRTWWASILMLGNYIDTTNICYPTLWTVPCDFHLTIVSTVLLYIYRRNRRTSIALYAILIVISLILPGLHVYQNSLLPVAPFGLESVDRYRESLFGSALYLRSHLRATPYLIGLGLGYVMSVYKPSKYRNAISKVISSIIFVMLVTSTVILLAIGGRFHFPETEYNIWSSVAFASFHRTIWALVFSCFLIVCEYGSLPLVQNILSWSPMVPLSKLSYGLYLVHTVFYSRIAATIRFPARYDFVELNVLIAGTVFWGFIISFLLNLFIEAPINNIIKIFSDGRLAVEKDDKKSTAFKVQNGSKKIR